MVDGMDSEQHILSMLEHPFLVRLHYWFEDDRSNLYLVIDFVAGGELAHQLRKSVFFTVLSIFFATEQANEKHCHTGSINKCVHEIEWVDSPNGKHVST